MIRVPGFGETVAGQGNDRRRSGVSKRGCGAPGVLAELGNVRVLSQSVTTVLRGAGPDQAALMAVVNRL